MHWIPCALHLARAKAGRSMAARIAIMAMTTSNSINVNPLEWRGRFIVNSREFIRLFIRPLFHGALNAQIIGHLGGGGILVIVPENFWDFPLPSFGVAVSKRKIAALVVAVARHVVPDLRRAFYVHRVSKLRVHHGIGMF